MRAYGLAVLVMLCMGACRQIAGLENLEPPADAEPLAYDGGPGCSCAGCTVLAHDDLLEPQSLVVVNGTVYWLDSGSSGNNGRLMSVSTTSGGPPVELVPDLNSPLSLTTDNSSLY